MSVFFILNNVHFAVEVLGALAFLVVAWLAYDSYTIRKSLLTASRFIGFSFLAIWQILHAFSLSGDIAGYIAYTFYFLGLILVLRSLYLEQANRPRLSVVVVLPALLVLAPYFNTLITLSLGLIAYLSYKQYKLENNKSLIPFWVGFLFLSAGSFISIFFPEQSFNLIWTLGLVLEFIGFVSIGWWVWQYLQLRIKEEIILIFVSMALLMSLVVTLAFSTILLNQIESATKGSLLTNTKVLDYAVTRLGEEALAKAQLLASGDGISNSLLDEDFEQLELLSTEFLEDEKLGFLTIVNENGEVLLRAHGLTQKGDSLSGERAVDEALSGRPFSTIETSPAEKFSIRAAAPIISDGEVIGAIITGFPLDNNLLDSIKRITNLEMTIYENDLSVASTLLKPDGRSRSTGIKQADSLVLETVMVKGEPITLRTEILSSQFLASYLPIRDADDNIVGAFSAAKPQQEILDVANATNRLTLITVVIIMLILIFPISVLTRRLTESE